LRPVLLSISGPPLPGKPFPLRRLDPTCRLRGWRTLAEEVDRLRDELAARGIEPILAGAAWTIPGELAFYCRGHPQVYYLGPALGDRYSQHDLWRPNPLADPHHFAGRTFIVVSPGCDLAPGFEELEPPRVVTHCEDAQPVARWWIQVGHGYRGFELPCKKWF
jgi:hypothetical protein